MRTKRTEITVETHRTLVLRRGQLSKVMWCRECLAETQMISPHDAAALTGVSSRTIFQWIETARLHFIEEPGAPLMICVPSLRAINHGMLKRPGGTS
jgi:hypothetical protein